MLKYIFYIGIILMSSCKKESIKIISDLYNKKIIFSEYLKYDSQYNVFKVIVYTNETGCIDCKLQLSTWKNFIEKMPVNIKDSVKFYFIFATNDSAKIDYLFKSNDFHHEFYIDDKKYFNKLNDLAKDERFHTFLLDRDNRVKAIGNPVRNPKIKELYLKVITGDTLLKKQAAQTTIEYETTVYDLGEFTPNESREAVFALKNTGTQPLLVADVVMSCGCATPRYDKKPVNPGETLKITVEMKIKEEEYFEKTISVYCNTQNSPVLFNVKGRIVHEK